jgi:hypothetical protein
MSTGGNQPNNRAQDAQRSFSSLDWKERARIVNEAEARQLRYFNQIMPMAQSAALFPEPDIDTPEEAQKALLLESYYGLLEATLKGQELFLEPWVTTKESQERDRDVERWKRQAAEENTCLQAVQERGDWLPLKEKWYRRIPPAARTSETGGGEGDWLRGISGRMMKDLFGRRSMTYDYARTQRVLALAPDRSPPMRAASLDADPPLL